MLRASASGSPPWLEAKYHQIAWLSKTAPASAKHVLAQFRALQPRVEAPWDEKFDALERSLR